MQRSKERAKKYREKARQTELQRSNMRRTHAAALQELAAKLRKMLDEKGVPIDFVTGHVEAHTAELALIDDLENRLAACRRHASEMRGLEAKLKALNAAGDKRVSDAEPLRAKAALLKAELRSLDEATPAINLDDFATQLVKTEELGTLCQLTHEQLVGGTGSTFEALNAGRQYFQKRALCALACGEIQDAWEDARKGLQFSHGETPCATKASATQGNRVSNGWFDYCVA